MHRILSCHSAYYSIDRETGFFGLSNFCNFNHFNLKDGDWQKLVDNSTGPGAYFSQAAELIRKDQGLDTGRFVEKTPQHVMKLDRLLNIFPNAKVINMVRDGRDCYCSSKSHVNVPQRKSVHCFARYWKGCIDARIRCGEDPRIFDLRYEDLADEPHLKLGELMEFLGSKKEEQQLDPRVLSSDWRSNNENFSRLKEPISSRTVGRWKLELEADEGRCFEQIARGQLKFFGYEVR